MIGLAIIGCGLFLLGLVCGYVIKPDIPAGSKLCNEKLECAKEYYRRLYYQGIVYSVCIWIDGILGGRVVCGSYEMPSNGVEEALKKINDGRWVFMAKDAHELNIRKGRVGVDAKGND